MNKTMVLNTVSEQFSHRSVSKTTMERKYLSFLASCGSGLVKLTALWLIGSAIYWATTTKFDQLRSYRDSMPTSVANVDDKMRQLDCLTRNIYWEAAQEPFEGKVAVAQVTLNRVASGRFAPTVCGVVYQKNIIYERVVCQFSWFCETNHKIRPIHGPMWKESEEVAKRVLFEGFRLPGLKNALYYHADYVNPGWPYARIDKIGRHIFYGDKS